MLFDKPLKSGETVTIKLTTGEELIARFDEEQDGNIVANKPVVLAPGAGRRIGMVPWIMSAEPDKVRINKENILTYTTTQKEIADKYIEMTSSITLV